MKEIDNQLLKEKVIEDQTKTIKELQIQLKAKTNKLNQANEENSLAEEEMVKVNDNLIQKNMELEKELSEKHRLAQKLKVNNFFYVICKYCFRNL